MAKSITKSCLKCNKDFKIYQCWIRSNSGKFCSRKCSAIGRIKKPKTLILGNCLECKSEFSRRKGSTGTMQYCSIPCMSIARGRTMRQENHPRWNGGSSERSWKSRSIIAQKKKQIKSCEECNSINNLQGHHILDWSNNVSKRESIDNIKILCTDCHANKHDNLKNFIKGIKHG